MEKKDVVDKIVKHVRESGGKVYKTDGNYKPDLFGVYKDKCIAIECKDTGKLNEVTEGQQIELNSWNKAGAIAFATDSLEDFKTKFEDEVMAVTLWK